MRHNIPDEIRNSTIEFCLNEYVRNEEQREMLRDRWFNFMTLEQIAEKHHVSESTAKRILYGIGDKVLCKASELNRI